MTGEIVEFPGRELPPEGYSEQYIEEGICDCATMAKSAAQMVLAQDDGSNRKLIFAVCHVSEMLDAFKASYYAAWHGETPRVAAP